MKKKKITNRNDHIIIPIATLKRFEYWDVKKSKPMIDYLVFEDSACIEIRNYSPKSFHTEKNYYLTEIDNNIIQKYETLIGNITKELETLFASNNSNTSFTPDILKKHIIELITIQFHRSVIADDKLLIQYKNKRLNEFHRDSLHYMSIGKYPPDFLMKKMEFENKSKTMDEFRYYAQSILEHDNTAIIETYRNHISCILHIPDDVDSTFLLPPQHYVGFDTTARFVLSPKIAVALYPQKSNPPYIKSLSKDDADDLTWKTIESALIMSTPYREVIGEKKHLERMKRELEIYKENMTFCQESNLLFIDGQKELLFNNLQVVGLIISIQFYYPTCKKVIIEQSTFSSQLLYKDNCDWVNLFNKWEIKVVLISNVPISGLKHVASKSQAIDFFNANL